ncbi:hypothetical protein E0H73_18235 [Kribbella pittospori]|uniref:Aminoglycoside phosphotransferase domain-containing protein n=1 Tax=Kribbella pittospori TaxID=722689 RepID=A0A4R0KMZ3_9ACTN|nr:phosphotransferase [Kribbella pittospori]TCC61187.1 hypothetical protein E0H73_18235 [Kribbella pittospori]
MAGLPEHRDRAARRDRAGRPGATLTAIIDWSDATYGDPLYDLARFSISGATEALLDGYGIELTPAIEKTFSLYRIVWSLIALYAEHRAGGDWFDAHIVRITKELPG